MTFLSIRSSGIIARVVAGLGVVVALSLTAPAGATVEFTGSGINPEVNANAAGSASFTITGNTLTILLTNTTAPRTASQGNGLTGVVFDLIGSAPVLAFGGPSLSPGSDIWTSKFSSNTSDPLLGSWTNQLGVAPLAAYGAAATGFAGAFSAAGITLGNGGPDYGIVAANTFDGTNVSFGGSQFPFIQRSLTLTFTGVNGISESQIGNVRLLFGTDGTGVITTVPAPGAVALLVVAAGIARRRRAR